MSSEQPQKKIVKAVMTPGPSVTQITEIMTTPIGKEEFENLVGFWYASV